MKKKHLFPLALISIVAIASFKDTSCFYDTQSVTKVNDLVATGTLYGSGSATFAGTLYGSGSATFNSDLSVAGVSTLTGLTKVSAIRLGFTGTEPGIIQGTGDPNTVYTRTQGTIFLRSDVAQLWQNTTGFAVWSQIGTGTVSSITFSGGLTSTPNPIVSTGTASIATAGVTLAMMADLATDKLIGRDTAGTGVPESLSVSGGLEFSGSTGIQRSALTGDVTAPAASNSTTIANSAVTLAKMADLAQSTFVGRAAGAGTGVPTALTATQATAILNNVTTSLPGLVPAFPNNTTTFFRGDGTYATVAASAASFSGASIYGSATPTLPSGTEVRYDFDSENYDVSGYHSVSSSTGRLTVPTTGYYHYDVSGIIAGNVAGLRQVAIYLNSGDTCGSGTQIGFDREVPLLSASASDVIATAGDVKMTAGDYIIVCFMQNSGVNLTVATQVPNSFSIHLIGI